MALSLEVLKWHVFIVFLSLAAAWQDNYDHHIKVSSQGHDGTTCLTNYSTPCKTLEFVFNNTLNSSTLLEVTEGNYSLDNVYNIKDKHDIAIVGEPDKVVIRCNTSLNTTGLSWQQSENLNFSFLIFDGCGHVIYTSPLGNLNDTIYNFYTGLLFVYCRNLVFSNCTFINSRGLAITAYDSGGEVSFSGSYFIRNGAANVTYIETNDNMQRSGGGVMIHLTKYGYVPPFNDTIHKLYSNNNRFYFKDTVFHYNSYHKSSTKEVPSPFGWGGGLTIIVCGSAKNNRFSVDSSHFEGNEAIWGGGVFTEFHDLAGANSISLSGNRFELNFARYAGGAVRTGNNIIEQNVNASVNENKIELSRNYFFKNNATLGGAFSHYGWTYHQKTDDYRNISLKGCIFDGNIATIGSSIALNQNDGNNWLSMGPQLPYIVHLVDCAFNNNIASPINRTVMGMGSVYTSRVPLVLKGHNSFINNNSTALLLDNAPLKVINEAVFIGNTGYMGGALAFYGQSKLVMTRNSRLFFKHNIASQKGGAIYIRTPGPDIAPFKTTELRRYQCILQYEDADSKVISVDQIDKWQTKLEFLKNSAPQFYGNSLYATTLQSCYRQGETSTKNTAFEWENITNFHGGAVDEEISTNPVAIDFDRSDWYRAPYEMFDASLHLRDEKNTTVSGIAKIDISSDSGSSYPKLEPESSLFLVQAVNKTNGSIKSVVPGLRIKGKENQPFTLKISTFDGQVIEVSSKMKLGKCREGFEQPEDRYQCICMKDTDEYHEGIHNCSDDGSSVNLKMGYWGGLVPSRTDTAESEVFVTYPCPEHYCTFDPKKPFFTYNKDTICSYDRTSHLCGACKEGYTLTLGNEKCHSVVSCEKDGYDYKWTLPVFFLVVPVVVLILLRLDFDIFTPYLGSWLYFYQILPYVVQQIERFDKVMRVVLSLTSWRLPGAHFNCFMKGLDNITKLFFNFLLPLYVLFVVIAIVKITRWCGRRWFGRSNVFNAISTIVVFSYTDLTIISFNAIRWVPLSNLKVLYVQGSVTSNDIHEHAIYYALLVLAIIVILLFVIALPLTLIFKPFLPRITFLANFTNLFDIFQSCYRAKWICFSAYYFILRILIILLTSQVLSAPGPLQRYWIDVVLVLSLIVIVYVKPYKTDEDSNVRWLNFVDTFILTILYLMSRMSSARNSEASSTTSEGLSTAIKVLSWFPMMYLLLLIVCAVRKRRATARRQHDYQNLEDVSTGGTDDDRGTGGTSMTKPLGTGETSLTSRSSYPGSGETSLTGRISNPGAGETSMGNTYNTNQ